jgi:hypothetical protein
VIRSSCGMALSPGDSSRALSGFERDRIANPTRSVKPRAREFWRYLGTKRRRQGTPRSRVSPCENSLRRKFFTGLRIASKENRQRLVSRRQRMAGPARLATRGLCRLSSPGRT